MTDEWQPIESAPKEPREDWFGPRILLATIHHDHAVICIARFHYGAHQRFLDERNQSSVSAAPDCPDSYWMPLPAPPTDQHKEAGT